MMENKTTIVKSLIETPIGFMMAGATENGICLFEFDDRQRLEKQQKSLMTLLNATIIEGESKYFTILHQQLKEYFDGTRKAFTIPLVTPGTEFQQRVWNELLKIPYGTTRSYKQQALAIKNIEAIRAVAHTNGLNRISIIIPCHRVIGDNGNLTGYGGGLWRKKWLLDLEKGQKNLSL